MSLRKLWHFWLILLFAAVAATVLRVIVRVDDDTFFRFAGAILGGALLGLGVSTLLYGAVEAASWCAEEVPKLFYRWSAGIVHSVPCADDGRVLNNLGHSVQPHYPVPKPQRQRARQSESGAVSHPEADLWPKCGATMVLLAPDAPSRLRIFESSSSVGGFER